MAVCLITTAASRCFFLQLVGVQLLGHLDCRRMRLMPWVHASRSAYGRPWPWAVQSALVKLCQPPLAGSSCKCSLAALSKSATSLEMLEACCCACTNWDEGDVRTLLLTGHMGLLQAWENAGLGRDNSLGLAAGQPVASLSSRCKLALYVCLCWPKSQAVHPQP